MTDHYGKAGLAAATLALALLSYMATCSSARAISFEIRYRHGGGVGAFGQRTVVKCPGEAMD